MKKLVLAGFVVAAFAGASGAQAMTLGNWLEGRQVTRSPIVHNVQATPQEVQIQQLQETIRKLTGRIEDLNFQVLQMQEQLRKTQEDNEFRFQQLEKKAGKKASADIPADKGTNEVADSAASSPANSANDMASQAANKGIREQALPGVGDTTVNTASNENQTAVDQSGGQDMTSSETAHLQPGTLGSLIFNGDGQIVDTTRNPADNSSDTLPSAHPSDAVETGNNGSKTPVQEASVAPDAGSQKPASADASYDSAYGYILNGDYKKAEAGFRSYLEDYPEDTKAADASFWLGEAQYSQGRYNDAAKTFLNAYKTYGQSKKAPEILLKLGMSLAALDNKDTACATLREIPKRFPKASKAVFSKVSSEESRLACS